MSRDIERLLERAAGSPARLDDTKRLWRKGRRRRLRDFSALASASTLLIAGLAVYGLPFAGDDGGPAASGGDDKIGNICAADEFGCVPIPRGDPITLGTLLALSGSNESLGLDAQRGAILAAERRGNEVAGHGIEWQHEDDRCSPEGEIGAQRLADNPQVVAVVGTSCSSAGEPAADILSDAGVVLISPSNTAPQMTARGSREPFYFRVSHNDGVQAAAIAEFAIGELGVDSAATIYDGSPYGETLVAEFERTFKAAGGEITATEEIAIGNKNFHSELASIAATEPELLYYPLFFDEGWRVTKQARSMAEFEGVLLSGSDGMLTREWLRSAGPSAEGVYLSQADLEFGGASYEQNLLARYRERWGEPIGTWHAQAYDATDLVLDAVEAVAIRDQTDGTTYIPRTALRDALSATSGYRGLTGELTCNELGDCNPHATVQVMRVTNGSFEPVWERPK